MNLGDKIFSEGAAGVLVMLSLLACFNDSPAGPAECLPTDSVPLTPVVTPLYPADTVGWVYVGFCVEQNNWHIP